MMTRSTLMANGYAHYMPRISQDYSVEDFEDLRREFKELEQDEYAPLGVNRSRRYGNGIILPWQESVSRHWLPVVEDSVGRGRAGYDQGGNNPDHADIRYFYALSESVKNNRILLDLIDEDFSLTFWKHPGQPLPIYFGVHFVKLISMKRGTLGISSPNFFHQDGEPFTFAHLIYRSANMVGGVNYIGSTELRNVSLEQAPFHKIYNEFTLTEPFGSFVVHDPKVSHYVSPIEKIDDSDSEVCERCIVLIDFSPMTQKI